MRTMHHCRGSNPPTATRSVQPTSSVTKAPEMEKYGSSVPAVDIQTDRPAQDAPTKLVAEIKKINSAKVGTANTRDDIAVCDP